MGSAGSGARTNWRTLSEVKDEDMGHGEKVQLFLLFFLFKKEFFSLATLVVDHFRPYSRIPHLSARNKNCHEYLI